MKFNKSFFFFKNVTFLLLRLPIPFAKLANLIICSGFILSLELVHQHPNLPGYRWLAWKIQGCLHSCILYFSYLDMILPPRSSGWRIFLLLASQEASEVDQAMWSFWEDHWMLGLQTRGEGMHSFKDVLDCLIVLPGCSEGIANTRNILYKQWNSTRPFF